MYNSLSADNPVFSDYDAVFLAAPIENSGLQLDGVGVLDMKKRKFQTTVTTFVRVRFRLSIPFWHDFQAITNQ